MSAVSQVIFSFGTALLRAVTGGGVADLAEVTQRIGRSCLSSIGTQMIPAMPPRSEKPTLWFPANSMCSRQNIVYSIPVRTVWTLLMLPSGGLRTCSLGQSSADTMIGRFFSRAASSHGSPVDRRYDRGTAADVVTPREEQPLTPALSPLPFRAALLPAGIFAWDTGVRPVHVRSAAPVVLFDRVHSWARAQIIMRSVEDVFSGWRRAGDVCNPGGSSRQARCPVPLCSSLRRAYHHLAAVRRWAR